MPTYFKSIYAVILVRIIRRVNIPFCIPSEGNTRIETRQSRLVKTSKQ